MSLPIVESVEEERYEDFERGDVVLVEGAVCTVLSARGGSLLVRPRNGSPERIVQIRDAEIAPPELW